MQSDPPSDSSRPAPYGSAADLPSYQDLSQQIQGLKLLTRFIARKQRQEILKIEQEMQRLTKVVDDFYKRLGSRNWIFHDLLSVDKIERLLAETSDADHAERRLVELYRDSESTNWWMMRLRAQDGLRERLHQIERAREHYEADQFDSCVLHLIAVMDGFVNDFEPSERRGLHSRDPDHIVAWDSVVGHHMGLTHAMETFTKTIKKRIDEEIFNLYRHGIMHGSVVNFDNVIVATKAWNMLFAVADWATATRKAKRPQEPKPSLRDTWSTLSRHAAYKKYEKEFVPSTIKPEDPGFATNDLVQYTSKLLDAWEHGRWALVAGFMPPALRGSRSDGQSASDAKDVFGQYDLTAWNITSITYDKASTAEVRAVATVNEEITDFRFRMALCTTDGNVAMPGEDGATWYLAVWAPHTFFQDAE